MASPMTSAQFVRLLDNLLTDASAGAVDELNENMINTLYNVVDAKKGWEEYYGTGALPDVPEFNGTLEYSSIAPGYHTKIEPKEYAQGILFERKLIDDNQYNVLTNAAEEMRKSAERVRAKFAARPFAYAFSAAFDFMTSEENLSLCNTTHTTKSGVSTASGFSNSGTAALSKSALASARLTMRRIKNDVGERAEIDPDTLLVPDALYDTAMEIVGTDSGYDTAANTKNMMKNRFKVIPFKRLDDYSTKNWYLIDSRLMKKKLYWLNRVKDEINNMPDFETFSMKHSIYFRFGNGFTGWRWIYGNNVS